MKIRGIYKNRKFYKRILIFLILVSITFISIFSLISYFNIQKVVLDNEYEANRKMLNQIMFNINYLDETMNKISIQIFYNQYVKYIMNNDEVDTIDVYYAQRSIISNLFDPNSFIHAIYVCNNKTKKVYSFDGIFDYRKDINNILENITKIKVGKPFYRKSDKGNVVSYVVYEPNKDNNKITGALIVDASIDWIVNTLKSINMVDDKRNDEIFILDSKGQYITVDSKETKLMTDLKAVYARHKADLKDVDKKQGFFKDKIGKTDYLITYMPVSKADWVILKVQPYYSIFKNAQEIKYFFIILTVVFIILVLIISVFVSSYIYKPFGRLVKQVTLSDNNFLKPDFLPENLKDEITFLNDTYAYTNKLLEKYKLQMESNKDMRKEVFLRKLFTESDAISDDELIMAKDELNLNIPLNGRYIVCILKIDDYKAFQDKFSFEDRELYKFSMMDMFKNVISGSHKIETIDMKSDHTSILVSVDNDEGYNEKLRKLIREAQELYYYNMHISVTAVISEPVGDINQITTVYQTVLYNSLYRFVFGKMSIITEDMVKSNNENTTVMYSESSQKKLKDALKLENPDNIDNALKCILNEISGLSYNNIVLSIIYMINIIKTTIDEVNVSRMVPIQINFNSVTSNVLKAETIQEIYEYIFNLLSTLYRNDTETDEKEILKKKILIDKIMNMIDEKYSDSGLCLQVIAEALKLSSRHVSKFFKTYTNMYISDYITQVRLKKAVELLEKSNLGINEIAFKIGLENETYFYTLFKKKFGVTPREYSMKYKINNSGN